MKDFRDANDRTRSQVYAHPTDLYIAPVTVMDVSAVFLELLSLSMQYNVTSNRHWEVDVRVHLVTRIDV